MRTKRSQPAFEPVYSKRMGKCNIIIVVHLCRTGPQNPSSRASGHMYASFRLGAQVEINIRIGCISTRCTRKPPQCVDSNIAQCTSWPESDWQMPCTSETTCRDTVARCSISRSTFVLQEPLRHAIDSPHRLTSRRSRWERLKDCR